MSKALPGWKDGGGIPGRRRARPKAQSSPKLCFSLFWLKQHKSLFHWSQGQCTSAFYLTWFPLAHLLCSQTIISQLFSIVIPPNYPTKMMLEMYHLRLPLPLAVSLPYTQFQWRLEEDRQVAPELNAGPAPQQPSVGGLGTRSHYPPQWRGGERNSWLLRSIIRKVGHCVTPIVTVSTRGPGRDLPFLQYIRFLSGILYVLFPMMPQRQASSPFCERGNWVKEVLTEWMDRKVKLVPLSKHFWAHIMD